MPQACARSRLREELLRLLEEDVELRYAVAGYLGLSEVLRRLDAVMGEVAKLWAEVKALREEQARLAGEQARLAQEQVKIWEEVRRLGERQERLESYVRVGLGELREALRLSFEDYARAFVGALLEELGFAGARVGRRVFVVEGEPVEVDIFCEEPLVVGEVMLRSVEEAKAEVDKLLKRVELVRRATGREPLLKILAVANAPSDVAEAPRGPSWAKGFKLILGRGLKPDPRGALTAGCLDLEAVLARQLPGPPAEVAPRPLDGHLPAEHLQSPPEPPLRLLHAGLVHPQQVLRVRSQQREEGPVPQPQPQQLLSRLLIPLVRPLVLPGRPHRVVEGLLHPLPCLLYTSPSPRD